MGPIASSQSGGQRIVRLGAYAIDGYIVLAATLVIDLAVGARPRSRAEVVVDR